MFQRFFLIIALLSTIMECAVASAYENQQAINEHVYMIYSESKSLPYGTAFVTRIDDEYVIITAAHTIELLDINVTNLKLENSMRQLRVNRAVIIDQAHDIGVIEVNENLISLKRKAKSLEQISAIGILPKENENAFLPPFLKRSTSLGGLNVTIPNYTVLPFFDYDQHPSPSIAKEYVVHAADNGRTIISSQYLQRGASGSPIISEDSGQIIGMLSAIYEKNEHPIGLASIIDSQIIYNAVKSYLIQKKIHYLKPWLNAIVAGKKKSVIRMFSNMTDQEFENIFKNMRHKRVLIPKLDAILMCNKDSSLVERLRKNVESDPDRMLKLFHDELEMLSNNNTSVCDFAHYNIFKKDMPNNIISSHYFMNNYIIPLKEYRESEK